MAANCAPEELSVLYEAINRTSMKAGFVCLRFSFGRVAFSRDRRPIWLRSAAICCHPFVKRPGARSGAVEVFDSSDAARTSAGSERRALFRVRREGGAPYFGQDYYAVRRGPWKLLHNTPFEPLALYNLDEDPQEQHDRIKEQPQIARELTAALAAHIQRAGRVPWQPPTKL